MDEIEKFREKLKAMDEKDFSVTYKLNKEEGIFNWYPYTEGFSKCFVDRMIDYFGIERHHLVLDPFGGCGTTSLACALNNISSVSIEVNPFMNFILQGKVESLELSPDYLNKCFLRIKEGFNKKKEIEIPSFLKEKNFFEKENLNQALKIKGSLLDLNLDKKTEDFFLVLLSSIIVKISNMVRATDLRYRKNKQEKIDVLNLYENKTRRAIEDLKKLNFRLKAKTYPISSDIREMSSEVKKFEDKVDFFITSPPYLNGTNYMRNTKLEMGFLNIIKSDEDLKNSRNKMVMAGINTSKKQKSENPRLSFITPLIRKLESNAYDKRIPLMVRGYFSDMYDSLRNIYFLMKEGGEGVIVIGDSQFGGVHVETDLILAKICELNGFKVNSIESVRKRRSRNGKNLRESLIFVRK